MQHSQAVVAGGGRGSESKRESRRNVIRGKGGRKWRKEEREHGSPLQPLAKLVHNSPFRYIITVKSKSQCFTVGMIRHLAWLSSWFCFSFPTEVPKTAVMCSTTADNRVCVKCEHLNAEAYRRCPSVASLEDGKEGTDRRQKGRVGSQRQVSPACHLEVV